LESLLQGLELVMEFGKGSGLVRAVDGVSIEVREGESVALMGPSGCGKSTLLRLLGLMLRPIAGSVLVYGEPAPSREAMRARLRNKVFGYLHQEFAIVEDESVEANVGIPLDYADPRFRRKERRDRVRRSLDHVGLGAVQDRTASRLSGGERQRVAIARAMVGAPAVILADEPTAALDRRNADRVVDLLINSRSAESAVIVATHDPRVAERCTRTVRMEDGRVLPPD
jgi:putative ABC transport system ATP-binding protein